MRTLVAWVALAATATAAGAGDARDAVLPRRHGTGRQRPARLSEAGDRHTGGDNVTETSWVKAKNTVHSGGARVSFVALPLVP